MIADQAVIADLRAAIGRLPRVALGTFPTPLTRCDRLSAALGGPRIFVKREDVSGLALGGNKTRLLEFRLAEALALQADVVVAGLEVQSNSARQLTAAANVLGLRTILLMRPEAEPPVWQGNLLLDAILGADIRFLDSPEADVDAALRAVAADERRRQHRPYVMNHADFFGPGAALAGLEWTLEVVEQLSDQGLAPSHFYLSSGGKCQAGMVLAQQLLGNPFAVVGLNANAHAGAPEATAAIANATAHILGLAHRVRPEDVANRTDCAGPGFGIATAAGNEAIRLVARQEGILLDPVFTGKAMAGLIADIRAGRLGPQHVVVFVHTGGIPALFSHARDFAPTGVSASTSPSGPRG